MIVPDQKLLMKNNLPHAGHANFMIKSIVLSFILLCAGCAGIFSTQSGDELSGQIRRAEERVRDNPGDTARITDLGVLYYKAGEYSRAAAVLEKAIQSQEHDGRALAYLGLAYEALHQVRSAWETYHKYSEIDRDSPYSQWLLGRFRVVQREKIRSDVAVMVYQKKHPALADSSRNSIVVLPPIYHGAHPRYGGMGFGLLEIMVEDLQQIESIEVVDRFLVKALLDELTRQGTFMKIPNPMSVVGKMLGSRSLVREAYNVIDYEQFVLDLTLWDLSGKGFPNTTTHVAELKDALKLQKDITLRVIAAMGLEPTPQQQAAISGLATTSLSAFLDFSEALAQMEAGEYSKAVGLFQRSLSADPQFQLCSRKLEEARTLGISTLDPDRFAAAKRLAETRQTLR